MAILEYDPQGPHPLTFIFWVMVCGNLILWPFLYYVGAFR